MSGRTMMCCIGVIATLGAGYGLWAIISPDERRKELIKNLPEANPLRMDETRKRNALIMQALKDAAETNDNIARRLGDKTLAPVQHSAEIKTN